MNEIIAIYSQVQNYWDHSKKLIIPLIRYIVIFQHVENI